MAVSGTGMTAATVGVLFLWSAIKGASPVQTLRDLLTGQQPKGTNVHPITVTNTGGNAGGSSSLPVIGSADAQQILAIAASIKGQPYLFGGGHTDNPCSASATDCSGYVSCVLNKAGVMKGSMDTGGFAGFGQGIPYDQRAPGDLIVWNGGTGGGHIGIIIDANTMWNNPCTGCGGVQISHYPYGSRTAAAAVIRRVTSGRK